MDTRDTRKNEFLLNKKINREILQGDSLSPILFVLCINPLSRKINEVFLNINVKIDVELFVKIINDLLMIKVFCRKRKHA